MADLFGGGAGAGEVSHDLWWVGAFIVESKRPDCEPGYRFRVTMPDGSAWWYATREKATEALVDAVSRKVR